MSKLCADAGADASVLAAQSIIRPQELRTIKRGDVSYAIDLIEEHAKMRLERDREAGLPWAQFGA